MSTTNDRPVTPPDGIGDDHARPISGWRRHASPLSLVVFGTVVLLSLTGVLGHERDWRAEGNGVALAVHAPETIRNGEFLEMRINVETEEPVGDLAIGVEQALWEDMTVNTMIPAAAAEESADGEFRFVFAELEARTPFLLKVDLQVNPDILGGNDGLVKVYDGDDLLVETRVDIAVLP
ncbi:MAG: hypothetical protein ACRDG7_06515 [Candidatus Limnocylindria bacterium]